MIGPEPQAVALPNMGSAFPRWDKIRAYLRQHALDLLHERGGFARLDQDGVEPGAARFVQVPEVRVAGRGDEGNMCGFREVADASGRFEARDAGQVEIEDDQVGEMALGGFDGAEPVGARQHFVPAESQVKRPHFERVDVVIHEEDPNCGARIGRSVCHCLIAQSPDCPISIWPESSKSGLKMRASRLGLR